MMEVELVQGDWEVGVVGFVDLVLFQKKSSESWKFGLILY